MSKAAYYLSYICLCGLVFLGLDGVSTAQAWDPFRSESRDVRRGNEHLEKGQSTEALEAYETAARKLPTAPGVQLNRGLALMASDKLDAAREAFKLATQGSATKEVRAQSYYDMGLAFMQQAEAAAKTDKLEEAQGFLRESVDAFKSSLRNGPKNRDAAWNLELARRRLVEVDKKQEEKKKQDEEQKKQDEEQDEKQDESKSDEEKQDPASDDQKKQDEEQSSGDENEDKSGEDKKSEDKKQDGQKDPNKPDPANDPKNQQKPEQPKPQEGDGQEPEPETMPQPMKQALDALSAGEENLEKVRARMRAAQKPQRVEKDW